MSVTEEVTEPTPQGLNRYPDTDGYFVAVDLRDTPREPCTCGDFCRDPCAGNCGCVACGLRFALFCDEGGFYNTEFTPEVEALALKHYGARN
jgi:hypothetical protein